MPPVCLEQATILVALAARDLGGRRWLGRSTLGHSTSRGRGAARLELRWQEAAARYPEGLTALLAQLPAQMTALRRGCRPGRQTSWLWPVRPTSSWCLAIDIGARSLPAPLVLVYHPHRSNFPPGSPGPRIRSDGNAGPRGLGAANSASVLGNRAWTPWRSRTNRLLAFHREISLESRPG